MQICKTVTLRTKKLKNGMLSYYIWITIPDSVIISP